MYLNSIQARTFSKLIQMIDVGVALDLQSTINCVSLCGVLNNYIVMQMEWSPIQHYMKQKINGKSKGMFM